MRLRNAYRWLSLSDARAWREEVEVHLETLWFVKNMG